MLLSYISVPKEQPDGSITYVRVPLDDFKAPQATQTPQARKQSRDWICWFRGLRI